MAVNEIADIILREVYTAHFERGERISIDEIAARYQIERSEISKNVRLLIDDGLVGNGYGGSISVTSEGIISAEESGIAPEELAQQNNEIRTQILEYLARVFRENDSGLANDRTMIAEIGVDQRLAHFNLDILDYLGLVDIRGSGFLRIISRGLERVKEHDRTEEEETMATEQKTCFVIMPFSETDTCTEDEWTDIFENLIKPAVEEIGLGNSCKRSEATRGNIIKDIINDLHDSYVVIADLTDRNPNVFYELGVRHSLRHRTILITQNPEDVPFDLKPYGYHVYDWKTQADKQKFREKIKGLLEEIEQNPDKPDNPVADFWHGQGSLRIAESSASDSQKSDLLQICRNALGMHQRLTDALNMASVNPERALRELERVDDWISSEASGYPEEEVLSQFRKWKGVVGTIVGQEGNTILNTLEQHEGLTQFGEEIKQRVSELAGESQDPVVRQISDADALNILESWMGSRPAKLNTQVIRFDEVDSEHDFPSGTAKRLLEKAAQRWKYRVRRKSEETILLEGGRDDGSGSTIMGGIREMDF